MLKRILSDHPSRQALDRGTDAGGAEAFVEFAPASHAVIGGDLDEVIVAPAGVTAEEFDARDF